jgi:radical SAM-linked protein
MWERAFRRVQLPVAYSAGFSPRPRVSFGLALPTGHESVAEYLDVEVTEPATIDVTTLPARLTAALPLGVEAMAVEPIPPGTLSLQEDVASCTWRWVAAPTEGADPPGMEELERRVAAVLAAPSVVVTRTRKGEQVTDDIRAGILDLRILEPAGPELSDGVWLEAELVSRPRSLRPAEVLAALDPGSPEKPGLEERLVRRTHQWILRDGARSEPLACSGVPGAPHALERAS